MKVKIKKKMGGKMNQQCIHNKFHTYHPLKYHIIMISNITCNMEQLYITLILSRRGYFDWNPYNINHYMASCWVKAMIECYAGASKRKMLIRFWRLCRMDQLVSIFHATQFLTKCWDMDIIGPWFLNTPMHTQEAVRYARFLQ